MSYELQVKKGKSSFRVFGQPDVHGPLPHDAHRLFQSVSQALEAGLFYNSEVYAFVVNAMKEWLTPEVLSANSKTMPTENGYFGTDIYYMRKDVVEPVMSRIANKQAIAYYDLAIGDVVKSLSTNGHRFSTSTITAINPEMGHVVFECRKRGSRNRWELSIGANSPSLIQALEANEFPSYIERVESQPGVQALSIDLGSNHHLYFKPNRAQ